VRDVYAARALAAGSIKLVIDAAVPTPAGYFVVVQPERMVLPKIRAFRQWIMQEAGVA
jgi:LysR family glycine cleavage system transcriptional activator